MADADAEKAAAEAAAAAKKADEEKAAAEAKAAADKKAADNAAAAGKGTRRSAASFIINRQKRKIEKLKEKGEGDEDGDINGDGELTPEAQAAVDRAIAPTQKALKERLDEEELRDHLASHPDHKEVEAAVREKMAKPEYAQVPIEDIFFAEAARKGIVPKGDEAAKEKAKREAEANRAGGGGARASFAEGDLPDAYSHTPEQFAAIAHKVKTGR